MENNNVAIDTAFATAEGYQMVVDSGYKWKALKGDDAMLFLVGEGAGRRKQIWDISPVDPALGTAMAGRVRPIKLYLFSKPSTLHRLYTMMYGDLGDWQLHEETSEEYNLQVTAWDRRYRTNANGRGEIIGEWCQKRMKDNATDCERMQIAVADITGLLSAPREGELGLTTEVSGRDYGLRY